MRFLNEQGGGTISSIEGKDLVFVRDPDGFEIPVLRSEVVVIGDDIDEINFPHPSLKKKPESEPASEKEQGDRPVTFKAPPLERRGGDVLNVYLGYIASSQDQEIFKSYVINDSNFYLQFQLLTYENAVCHSRFLATVEPNTKQLIEEFPRARLGEMERLRVQLLAYKTTKPFSPKPAIATDLRLNSVKFYKTFSFRRTPFFKAPALLLQVVRDDLPRGSDVEVAGKG